MKRPGQISLVPFPRVDLTPGKPRPVLLLAPVPGPYDDWLVCMISTRRHQEVAGFDEIIEPHDQDFTASGLKSPSVCRIARLAVVADEMLPGAIGGISTARLARIRARLAAWLRDETPESAISGGHS